MQLLPVLTPLLRPGDPLSDILRAAQQITQRDILILSSKALATVEGAAMNEKTLKISDDAKRYAASTSRSEGFMQAVLDETKRLQGTVVGECPKAVLTRLKPEGLKTGTLLVPNAGLDESNVEKDFAIGWPKDPVASVVTLSQELGLPVILSDSCCIPGRMGVTAFALVCCGIDPFQSEIGKKDLYGKEMSVTVEAVADQLAVAANMLMGNAAQSIPAVIIRDHHFEVSNFCGWVDGIEGENDLFRDILRI